MEVTTAYAPRRHQVLSPNSFSFPAPGELRDQVLPRPSVWNGQPVTALLTSEELASGCIVYLVERNALAPHLLANDLIVAQPVAKEEWSILQVGSHYVLVEQMGAQRRSHEPAYLIEQIARVTSCTKKLVYGMADMGNGEEQEEVFTQRNLFGVYHVCRLIRAV